MEKTLQDLIQDAKSTTLYYAILIALLAFCLSLTSNFFWFNIPISILILSVLRLFSSEIELQWRMSPIYQESYHSHLNVQSASHSDPLLFSSHISKKWNRRIDSPVVGAAVDDFIVKIINVFIMDLWYSSLTPDQEFPNQIRSLLNDVMGEVVQRLKQINFIELLTRDVVDLIGSHIELYRRNQACIGVDVMETLSLNERDERLKHYLASSKELHPALISSDTECKVLQQLMGGVVAIVLRPQDVQCPIVRSIARELLACAVMQPIMDFASPMFINELIEFLVLSSKEEPPNGKMDADEPDIVSIGKNTSETPQDSDSFCMQDSSIDSIDPKNRFLQSNRNGAKKGDFHQRSLTSLHKKLPNDQLQVVCDSKSQSDDSPKLVETERQRRTEVPAHDTHENLSAKGRSYKLNDSSGHQYSSDALIKSLVSQQHSESKLKQEKVRNANDSIQKGNTGMSTTTDTLVMEGDAKLTDKEKQGSICSVVQCSYNTEYQDVNHNKRALVITGRSEIPRSHEKQEESRNHETQILKVQHRRSKSGGAELERWQKFDKLYISGDRGSLIPKNIHASEGGEVYGVFHIDSHSEAVQPKTDSIVVRKLDCWVLGVRFEKVGMKSIAVYSIAVTNSENKTWLVDRRYQNFEQLHRHLREIPNYKLHLPPKSFISSNLDDYFLRKRCILLDKYLKDLLSMPNIAEQHEVWDFLSATSKNYSFGKRTSVMETLAYNVDDAMVDIICQFKGVSSGLKHSIVGSVSAKKQHYASETWKSEGADLKETNWDRMNRSRYLSDEEEHVVGSGHGNNFGLQTDGWLSDTELHEEHFGSLLNTTPEQNNAVLIRERNRPPEKSSKPILIDDYCTAESLSGSEMIEDEFGGPPEWTPPKLCVPLLNLVERVFQLHKMGWLRQQVLWIGRQTLHLVMEDLIDNWLLRQIQWLRREDVIVAGIRQVQDVVVAKVIFTSENSNQQQRESTEASNSGDEALDGKVQTNTNSPESLQFQLEEVHRASLVYDIILGATAPLVTIVGREQYNRCAKDIYFFLQSTVCVKQLAYSLLELFLITIFPELHDLVCDIRNQSVLL